MTANLRIRIAVIAAIMLLAIPSTASAADVRQGNSVAVAPNEVVNDDLYAFAGTVDMRGTVNGDLVTAGGTVSVSGNVTGDVIAAGGTVNITGRVDGTVRATGGNIVVDGPVGQDAVMGGGTMVLGPESTVGRDLLAGGGSVTVGGEVGRNISVGAGTLVISGPVGGDIRAEVGTLRFENGARVSGNVAYRSNEEAQVAPGAQVTGPVVRQQPEVAPQTPVVSPILVWLRNLFGLFVAGSIFYLLAPRLTRRATDAIADSPWASLGLGFALLVGVPVLAILVFIAGLVLGGWWLGPMAMALYAILLVLGFTVAGFFLGLWGLARLGRREVHPILALLAGLAVLLLVSLVPFVGGVVSFIAVLFGLGAIAIAVARGRREPPTAAAIEEPPRRAAEAA